MSGRQCRPTSPISDRTPTVQHAGAPDLFEHGARSPAAKHFMCPGSLHGFVGRQWCHRAVSPSAAKSRQRTRAIATTNHR
jgi:hypothetical protein